MMMFNEPMPDCVPEYYRSLQEDAGSRYELRMQRQEHYWANRKKINAAAAAGLPILTLDGCGPCWDCQTADHDTMTADDDDIERVICFNPDCPHHKTKEEKEVKMNQKDFIEKLHALLPECPPEAAQIWYDFAVERVDQEQYVHFKAAESRDVSIGDWLEVLYEGLHQTRESFGAELAAKVAALSLEHCCLYPGEMPRAAERLRAGDGAKDILEGIESGRIDCADLFSAVPPEDVGSGSIPV